MKRKFPRQGREGSERRWLSRLLDWVGGAVIAALIGIPIARHYYELAARDSAAQTRHLEAVIKSAVRRGIVSAKYNSQGKVISLGIPAPLQNLHAQ